MYTNASIYKKDNLLLAYNRLIRNPESMYKNYFRDVYSAYGLALDSNLTILKERIKAGYIATQTTKVYMPKANGLSRMVTLLSIEDQIVYQAYANIIAEAIVNDKIRSRFKKTVFGNLYNGKDEEFFYHEWKKSYSAFTRAITRAYNSGYDHITSFDLTACYDSINHELLKNVLIRSNISEPVVNTFISLLAKWESEDMSIGIGIPQGPMSSGIVSEAILSKFDEYIETLQKSNDFKYYRYVDDIKILAKDIDTCEWILFLLDKKSKELGLFPQAAKISAHKIRDIDEEVKQISTPLFDEDFEEKEKIEYAEKRIKQLAKSKPVDLTSLKRYIHNVEPSYKINKVIINLVESNPNMIDSFAYYVKRYPRKIPKSILEYIVYLCNNRSRQYSAGVMLAAVRDNMSSKAKEKLTDVAINQLKSNKTKNHIVDPRYKAELILLASGATKGITNKQIIKYMRTEESWWIKKEILNRINEEMRNISGCEEAFKKAMTLSESADVAMIGASRYILSNDTISRSVKGKLNYYSQEILKEAGVINRGARSRSEIGKYIYEITGEKCSKFDWKKHLKKEHNQIEKQIFIAQNYWKNDLTAFVNCWDVINDSLLGILYAEHPELGDYQIGNIGSIKNSKRLKKAAPDFFVMMNYIHDLRLESNLSHYITQSTGSYTKPISQKNRKRIRKTLLAGINDYIRLF